MDVPAAANLVGMARDHLVAGKELEMNDRWLFI